MAGHAMYILLNREWVRRNWGTLCDDYDLPNGCRSMTVSEFEQAVDAGEVETLGATVIFTVPVSRA